MLSSASLSLRCDRLPLRRRGPSSAKSFDAQLSGSLANTCTGVSGEKAYERSCCSHVARRKSHHNMRRAGVGRRADRTWGVAQTSLEVSIFRDCLQVAEAGSRPSSDARRSVRSVVEEMWRLESRATSARVLDSAVHPGAGAPIPDNANLRVHSLLQFTRASHARYVLANACYEGQQILSRILRTCMRSLQCLPRSQCLRV